MRRSLTSRVDRLEGDAKPPPAHAPNVLHVLPGETIGEVIRRFDAEYPNRSKHHRLLIVPARDSADDDADFDAGFFKQQTKLIADAKSEPRKESGQ